MTTFYMIRNAVTGEVLPQHKGRWPRAIGNTDLAAPGTPPKLYPSRVGATRALRHWLDGHIGYAGGVSRNGGDRFASFGRQGHLTFEDIKAAGGVVKGGYAIVPVPARAGMAGNMEIVPVKLALGEDD